MHISFQSSRCRRDETQGDIIMDCSGGFNACQEAFTRLMPTLLGVGDPWMPQAAMIRALETVHRRFLAAASLHSSSAVAGGWHDVSGAHRAASNAVCGATAVAAPTRQTGRIASPPPHSSGGTWSTAVETADTSSSAAARQAASDDEDPAVLDTDTSAAPDDSSHIVAVDEDDRGGCSLPLVQLGPVSCDGGDDDASTHTVAVEAELQGPD